MGTDLVRYKAPRVIRRVATAPVRGLKSLTQMVFGYQGGLVWRFLPRTRFDYAREIGDGMSSSIIMAPILWMARTFPEAPLQVLDGDSQPIDKHPLIRLLRRPNKFYSGIVLWMATLISWVLDGNAYWIKVRNQAGTGVVELWYAPHWLIQPVGDPDNFITRYVYTAGGEQIPLDPSDIVHFRYGLDPRNPRKGLSPLGSLFREIFTDEEAANFAASLLRNVGVPGLVISPEGNQPTPSDDDVQATKDYTSEEFSGDRRGKPLVMSGPTKVQQFGFSPEQMQVRDLRRVPEERVTAILGLPAIVVGLGAGLDRCLPGDARVWTVLGAKPIRDVQPGDVVWSVVDGRLQPRAVTAWAPTDERPVFEIRTKNRVIRASGNHPVLCRIPGSLGGGSNYERRVTYGYKRADEIKPGDHVVQAKSLPDQGGQMLPTGDEATEDRMRWLGAMIGDGNVTGSTIRMAMPPEDRCHDDYVALAESLFTRQATASGGGLAVQERIGRAPITVGVRERDFGFRSARDARHLATLGVAGTAKTKRVPGWIFGLAEELRLAFLAGIVDSDGYIDSRGVLQVTLANHDLVHDVRDLLISCGIQCCNVRHSVIPASALPNPGLQDEYEAWSFVASSAQQVARIPFADALYRQRVETNAGRHKTDGFDAWKTGLDADGLGFYGVVDVKVTAPELLYDIEVAGGGHNFIADGVVVSNSTFANYKEAREAAYESNIIPSQRLFAEEIRHQLLLPDFQDNVDNGEEVAFDLSDVRVLQDDLNKLAERQATLYDAGLITRGEGRIPLGHESTDDDNVYKLAISDTIVPAGEVTATRLRGEDVAKRRRKGVKARTPSKASDRLMEAFARDRYRLEPVLAQELELDLDGLARKAAAEFEQLTKSANGHAKALLKAESDQALTEQILSALAITDWKDTQLKGRLETHYLRTAGMTVDTINNVMELGLMLPDPVQREILDAGGSRRGLIDVEQQSKDAILRALADGRENGDGPVEIARRIRQYVPAGRFVNAGSKYRSELIARSETMFAQRLSSLAAYQAAPSVTAVEIRDGLLADSDAECEERDGEIVSFDVANSLSASEHPLGSLSFSPIVVAPSDVEEGAIA